MIYTRKRLIAYVCTGYRTQSATPHAHHSGASQEMDPKRQGDALLEGGIFCIRLNVEPSARAVQPLAVGIDPGSKREGYSVVSAAHTYVNIQAQAREGVKQAEQDSSRMRRTRRHRKTPCRQPRPNRHHSKKKLPPSTR